MYSITPPPCGTYSYDSIKPHGLKTPLNIHNVVTSEFGFPDRFK